MTGEESEEIRREDEPFEITGCSRKPSGRLQIAGWSERRATTSRSSSWSIPTA